MQYITIILEQLTVFTQNPAIASLLGFCGLAIVIATVKNIIKI